MTNVQQNNFCKCSNCGFIWPTREKFIADHKIKIIGYQINYNNLNKGLFLFNHTCKGTLSIQAGVFKDLYNKPIFNKRLTKSDKCPEYCLYQDSLEQCPEECECTYVREIIQLLKNHETSN